MQLSYFRQVAAGGAVAALAFAGVGAFTATPAYAATSKVSVVHGIPATPVDVYVNGKKTLDNFQPGDVAGPLDLPAGNYDIALTKPGEPIDKRDPQGRRRRGARRRQHQRSPRTSTPPASRRSRRSSTTSPRSRAGKARLIVRHTAAAPAVDVRAGGTAGLQGPDQPERGQGRRRRRHRDGRRGAGRHRHRGHRPGRPEPQGGHRDDRLRDRLGRGQDPRPWWPRRSPACTPPRAACRAATVVRPAPA